MSAHRSHYIRTLVLDGLATARTYGIQHHLVLSGLLTTRGSVYVTRDDAEVEIDWLCQKGLILIEGDGETGRLRLSAKGLTFVNNKKPWEKLEVLE